jgi:hypothetical protein
MKKYYRSLDCALAAIESVRLGKPQEAAKYLHMAATQDDTDDMLQEVNQQQEDQDDSNEEEAVISKALSRILASEQELEVPQDTQQVEEENEPETAEQDDGMGTEDVDGDEQNRQQQVQARLERNKKSRY